MGFDCLSRASKRRDILSAGRHNCIAYVSTSILRNCRQVEGPSSFEGSSGTPRTSHCVPANLSGIVLFLERRRPTRNHLSSGGVNQTFLC